MLAYSGNSKSHLSLTLLMKPLLLLCFLSLIFTSFVSISVVQSMAPPPGLNFPFQTTLHCPLSFTPFYSFAEIQSPIVV